MKHLEFDGKYLDDLLSGKKKTTIRKFVRFKLGDRVLVHAGGKIVGEAKILSIEKKKIDEISDEDAKLDGFSSKEDLIAELKKLGYKDYIYVVKFEFKALDSVEPYKFYYGDESLEKIAKLAIENLNLSEEERKLLELYLKYKSIRKVASKLGGYKERGKVRKVLRSCLEKLKTEGLI
ncbi:MAG: ASCH domain-containing protein [Archaeoglobaceae archaeon]|nr:ASCH domain-containing protein [Archaeoglobaceae archaeon]MCX8151796.1 ASCH domain-containing protein [Archaeoglobaceae archaeon]MDW8013178.1 ASCH domain-containing protein [Archaeoglobaceae archaeon]